MNLPPIFAIDGYKLSHRPQYPNGTSLVYSNWTPRSNKHFKTPVFDNPELLWVGTQTFMINWLVNNFNQNFFKQPKILVCSYFKQVIDSYIGKDSVPIDGIENLHDIVPPLITHHYTPFQLMLHILRYHANCLGSVGLHSQPLQSYCIS